MYYEGCIGSRLKVCILFSFQTGAENVPDFDSFSSDSSDCSVPRPSPPPHLPTSTPTHARRPMTIRDFPNLACDPIAASTPEYMSIATPPSSPELTATTEVEHSLGKTTTSAWMKQIPLECEESPSRAVANETMHCLNDTALQGLGQSGEGGRRGTGRRGRKVVLGGLAEAVERVTQRESSEVTFWEHRARKMKDSDIGNGNPF